MIDFKPELVEALDKLLPTYYELFVDSSTALPCITYIETDNAAEEEGDNLFYSQLTYQIKIWGKALGEMMGYAEELDQIMRNLGFKRVSKNELWHNECGQLIFKYRALAVEKI